MSICDKRFIIDILMQLLKQKCFFVGCFNQYLFVAWLEKEFKLTIIGLRENDICKNEQESELCLLSLLID